MFTGSTNAKAYQEKKLSFCPFLDFFKKSSVVRFARQLSFAFSIIQT